MARPREDEEPLAKGRWVRFTQPIDELLDRICQREEKAFGRLLRGLIIDGLRARGYLPPERKRPSRPQAARPNESAMARAHPPA